MNDRERNVNSSYASESREALDLGLNVDADAESETTSMVETNR
ncbi:hypothetical protein [Paenibacillus sp. USHLN196]